jgi:hypothetical protein
MKDAAVSGEVLLERERWEAGDAIRGEVTGDHPEVRLVRVETSPMGEVPLVIATAEVRDGRFELPLPGGIAPTLRGRRCTIDYVMRAGVRKREPGDPMAVVTIANPGVPARVKEAEPLLDRMISRFDSRHFHLELAHADLRGGGELQGRVHWDKGDPPPMVHVTARCDEAWRADRGVVNMHHPPLWQWESLWQERHELEWPDGPRWLSYAFRIPEGLPPAVEATTIAWRYEFEVSRPVRLGMHERAVATPIGFDVAAVTSA